MKDSQQMSVDISSQDDMMALKALPPVSLKESNIFRVDSIVEDNLDTENYNLNLSDDDERGEKKQNSVSDSTVPEISQESEDEILNKFDSPENGESVTNTCQDSDENLEERLLNDLIDGKEENEEASITTNGECVNNNADISELNKKCEDIVSDTSDKKNCAADEEEKIREKEDDVVEKEKQIEDGEEKEKQMEEVEKEKVEEVVEEIENSEEIENEDAEEEKEKANAELLKNQIMDTEDLLQIVDQQDTGGTNENSCSGENTPDKEESDEAETECNDTETDKNEDEDDTQTSKNDDDTVDIEEDSPYKGDYDSELDKEYEKIVNEKENETLVEESNDKSDEKMDEEAGENAQEDKSVTESEKDNFQDSELDMEVSQNEKNEETNNTIETETTSDKQTSSDSSSKTKRTLSEPDTTVEAKRLRLEENDVVTEDLQADEEQVEEPKPVVKPSAPIIALNAISEYMQKRTLKKLTREDLEQICLMKMCEAICHKSEIGELRHQLSVQEQMIDMWRKEAAQLTKQARDLEIVNKRLLHEVRLKNDKDKPLIPVKITRSVGLQVRSDNNVMCNVMAQKRRFVRPQQPAVTNAAPKSQQNRFNQNKTVASPTNKTPINKSVTSSPSTKSPLPIKPKPVTQKTPNSLLSKALQNSTAQAANSSSTATATSTVTPPLASISNTSTTPTMPVTTKALSNASPKVIKATESKGVIDLTDEDEKKPSPASANASTTVNSTTQGVRIVSAPVKNTNTASSAGVVNPPRIMYLYNNQLHQGVLATDSSKVGSQKVMFKLNSNVIGQANGVLTAVTNGSPITVSNGTVRTNQVQSVRFSSPVTTVRTSPSSKAVAKHPAPLPPPPITQINLAARKPIPPKPHLSIRRSSGGIVLSWKMPYILDNYEAIASYQLYAYQETTSPPSSDMWRKVGDVKALALPMACTLTQFADGNKYHFAVRAVDVQKRMGPFSDPEQILL